MINMYYNPNGWKANRRIKHHAGEYMLIATLTFAGILIPTLIGYAQTSNDTLNVPTLSITPSIALKVPSTREYVLSEAEKAGISTSTIAKLVNCESRWNSEATRVNRAGIDRGLFQINSKYHPEVSYSCAYNVACSTREALRIVKERGIGEWVCASIVK